MNELKNIKKIAILRALQLGDMLCVIPAVRALRHAYPNAQITLLGMPWAKSFVERFSNYFDDFIHFPGYAGLPEQPYNPDAYERFLQEVKGREFDLILQMQGNGTIVNNLVLEMGAKYVAGFYIDQTDSNLTYFIPYPNFGSEIHRHLLLMQHLGIPSHGENLEFPLTQADYKDFDSLLLPLQVKNYICIHPGSRGYWRQWPPVFFAAIGDYCFDQGFTIVITGTEDERDITAEVKKCMHRPCIDLTGSTSLGSLGNINKKYFFAYIKLHRSIAPCRRPGNAFRNYKHGWRAAKVESA